MKNKIVALKIRDTEDGQILDTFLLVNPEQEKLDGLQDLIDSRYTDEELEDWDYGCVYEYIEENFTILGYDEEVIDY